MDRKHGKYVVNVEHSENQSPITCSDDQQAHNSACWHRPSNDTTGHISSNLTGVYVSPGVLVHSRYPHIELSNTQVKGNCCNNWSLWKVFLACLLASVITTAIGVLIICLVNNRGNDNSPMTSQLPPNDDITGMTSTTSKPAVTTTSTEPTTITTSHTESTTTAMSTKPTTSTAPTITTAGPTTLTASTVTTAAPTISTGATVTTTGPTPSTGTTITTAGPTTSRGAAITTAGLTTWTKK